MFGKSKRKFIAKVQANAFANCLTDLKRLDARINGITTEEIRRQFPDIWTKRFEAPVLAGKMKLMWKYASELQTMIDAGMSEVPSFANALQLLSDMVSHGEELSQDLQFSLRGAGATIPAERDDAQN